MHSFVRYHGHKLQTLFQKGRYFVTTYRQQLSPLPRTVPTFNSLLTVTGKFSVVKGLFVGCLTSRRPKKERPPQGNLEENSREGDEGKGLDMGPSGACLS